MLQAIIEDMIAEKIQKVEVHCWWVELEMWHHHDLQHHTTATMSSIIGIVSLALIQELTEKIQRHQYRQQLEQAAKAKLAKQKEPAADGSPRAGSHKPAYTQRGNGYL